MKVLKMVAGDNLEYAAHVIKSLLKTKNTFKAGKYYAIFVDMSLQQNKAIHDHELWAQAYDKGSELYNAFLEQLNDDEVSLLPLWNAQDKQQRIREGLNLAFDKKNSFACGYYLSLLSISLKAKGVEEALLEQL